MQPLWKAVNSQKIWNGPTFCSSYPFLSLYPKDLKLAYYYNATTSRFTAAQFTIARLWNQPRCPSTDEWIKKLWYIYTMEYYLAIKTNNIMAFADKRMELENTKENSENKNSKVGG